MMESDEPLTTVSSKKSKSFVVIPSMIIVCVILIILILYLISFRNRESSSKFGVIQSLKTISQPSTTIPTTTTTLSPEEIQRLLTFKTFLNLSSDRPYPDSSHSSTVMDRFMRSVYREIYDEIGARRRKRHESYHSNLFLSNEIDFIVSIPNQYQSSTKNITYHFEYNQTLDSLAYAEFILPIHQLSTIEIIFLTLNISLNQTVEKDRHWLKINLTPYITSFPLTFTLKFHHVKQLLSSFSSGFLTLYIRRSKHSISRRDLTSFYDNQLVTYPDDPSYCQVRPMRASFSDLDWSSWIIEPSSYEMNICSGTCHSESNMGTYFIIQKLLHQKYPHKVPVPCCRPKRFSSTILLYYDGPNLVLKRLERMRVVECGCSS